MELTPLVSSPADFIWKPKYEIRVTPTIPQLESRNASGVSRTVRLGASMVMVWELQFESSASTYNAIDDFLMRRGYGALPFTWRYHTKGITYTVKQAEPIQFTLRSDNTSEQLAQSIQFSLKIYRVADIAGL